MYGFDPALCGLLFAILQGEWTLRQSFQDKVQLLPRDSTGRAAFTMIGRCVAALRYLGLPPALFPSAYRFAGMLAWVDPDSPVPLPAGVADEAAGGRRIAELRRVWRAMPERCVYVATDATLVGWAAVVVAGAEVAMFASRWSTPQTSMPACEFVALLNGMLIAAHHFRDVYLERWGDCVPALVALVWVLRGLARSPMWNGWLARGVMWCEYARVVLGTRWMSTLVMPADAPSRSGIPDERTLAWRPRPAAREETMRGPEWPLALSSFADAAAAVPVLQSVLPRWEPLGARGRREGSLDWEFPCVWVNPREPSFAPVSPSCARLIAWTMGRRDFRLLVERDPAGWAPVLMLSMVGTIAEFAGEDPVVVRGVVVPPPAGWAAQQDGDTIELKS